MNTNKNLDIATTSCNIVNWEELEQEILENDLLIEKNGYQLIFQSLIILCVW